MKQTAMRANDDAEISKNHSLQTGTSGSGYDTKEKDVTEKLMFATFANLGIERGFAIDILVKEGFTVHLDAAQTLKYLHMGSTLRKRSAD